MAINWKSPRFIFFLITTGIVCFLLIRYLITEFMDDDALSRFAFDKMKRELGLHPKAIHPEKELLLIGCSWSRTATMSTKFALEHIGYSVYHGIDLERYEQRELWLNSHEDISQLHLAVEAILNEGFNSTIDWPQSFFCLELAEMFPNSKVFLNVRDSVDQWLSSFGKLCNIIAMFMDGTFPFYLVYSAMRGEMDMTFDAMGVPYQMEYVDSIFPWANFGVQLIYDDELAGKKYLEWIEKVKNTIPEERLLVFNVKEGWDPWVKFLGISEEVAETLPPFPNDNSGADLVWCYKFGMILGKGYPFIFLFLFLIIWLLIKLFRVLFCRVEKAKVQ